MTWKYDKVFKDTGALSGPCPPHRGSRAVKDHAEEHIRLRWNGTGWITLSSA
ncbi:hypothetical protein [Streptomyces sp. HUAS ZL42]|uniref:hypothetical protein n=1 Tax=Streptomyces sp. HUAS ZL42 TaxID=3231715 RepID=UPI00345EF379